MAIVRELDHAAFNEWAASRPAIIQELIKQLPPDRLYRIKTTGQKGILHSYNEGGTVSITLDGTFSRVLLPSIVFGFKPSDIEECELPAPGDDVGVTAYDAGYTNQDIEDILIPEMRRRMEAEKARRN